MSDLINFAALTIFARESLEGSIIVGEYRTIISRGDSLAPGIRIDDALREVTISAIGAAAFAVVVIAAVATPLAILSSQFDPTIAYIIEGISKIVAAVSLLQLSLELPKFLQVYRSTKRKSNTDNDNEQTEGMTLRYIRFNVAWNIWREVAECGIFLIPFFLTGENMKSLPLSAVIGSIVGLAAGYAIILANSRLKNKIQLAIFTVFVLIMLSAGLFSGGCRKLENEFGQTQMVWELNGDFWSVDTLPMTLLKPFGYSDSRTILQIITFWSWLALSAILHYRKYRLAGSLAQAIEDVERLSESKETASIEGVDIESGSCCNDGSLLQQKPARSNDENVIEIGNDCDLDSQATTSELSTVKENEENVIEIGNDCDLDSQATTNEFQIVEENDTKIVQTETPNG